MFLGFPADLSSAAVNVESALSEHEAKELLATTVRPAEADAEAVVKRAQGDREAAIAAAQAEAVVEGMRREHQAQRELFDRILRDLDETAVGNKLVIGVRELARAIRDDMAHEERELLSEP